MRIEMSQYAPIGWLHPAMGSLLTLIYAEHNNSSSMIEKFLFLLGIFFTLPDDPETTTCGGATSSCGAPFSTCGV
jgi:hypothetical protein